VGIFLLSDTNQLNSTLKRALVNAIAEHGNRIAYISSQPQDASRKYFSIAAQDYQSINPVISLDYFDLSENFSTNILESLTDYGIIHLSGGNTYTFLEALQNRGMKAVFQKHLDNKNLLIGVSAGAIALTPHIGTSELCGDVNSSSLANLVGMSFVDFCFLPHFGTLFDNSEENLELAQSFVSRIGGELYLAGDHDGILIEGSAVALYGNILKLIA